MKRFLLPLLIFLGLATLLCLALLGASRDESQALPSPLIGKPAPYYSLPRLDQLEKISTPQDLQGQVWILNVWASWCVSCREEHPVLLQFSQNYHIPLIGLNYKDKVDAATAWLMQYGNPYQWSIVDAEGLVGLDYGVYGVPESFVIDKRGVVRHKHIGILNDQQIREKLLPLIEVLKNE
ncbi:DsbE family thiol:disulfide interchange protein [Undibacterium flavidum]|uniref:DsbE family thiol:disulfide interchange protein n=1 Tax=Undibacterium flavidum TaxID=2762297 RepID=A0ABR6Y983_9BURK|nr:DsbE family thiol:disulfide interchange protein [Undibacterium flavidum]MBC3873175.1 DsbE family thiol:disulfide interchange protein [Undibacterium flavidum]